MNDFVAANHERRLKFYYKNYIGIYLSLYKIVSMVLRIVSTLVLNAFVIHVDIFIRFGMLSIQLCRVRYHIQYYFSILTVICILYQEPFDTWICYIIAHDICFVSYISPLHVYPHFIASLMIFGLPEWCTWRIILQYLVFVAVTNKTTNYIIMYIFLFDQSGITLLPMRTKVRQTVSIFF